MGGWWQRRLDVAKAPAQRRAQVHAELAPQAGLDTALSVLLYHPLSSTQKPEERQRRGLMRGIWVRAHWHLAGGQLLWKQHNKSELCSAFEFHRDQIWIRPAGPGGSEARGLANQRPNMNITRPGREGGRGPVATVKIWLTKESSSASPQHLFTRTTSALQISLADVILMASCGERAPRPTSLLFLHGAATWEFPWWVHSFFDSLDQPRMRCTKSLSH